MPEYNHNLMLSDDDADLTLSQTILGPVDPKQNAKQLVLFKA